MQSCSDVAMMRRQARLTCAHATHSTIAGKKKTTPWEKKLEQRRKQESIKQRERDMKAEKEAESDRKKQVTRERKQMAEEKARLEIMAQKVSEMLARSNGRRMDWLTLVLLLPCASVTIDERQEARAEAAPSGHHQEGLARMMRCQSTIDLLPSSHDSLAGIHCTFRLSACSVLHRRSSARSVGVLQCAGRRRWRVCVED